MLKLVTPPLVPLQLHVAEFVTSARSFAAFPPIDSAAGLAARCAESADLSLDQPDPRYFGGFTSLQSAKSAESESRIATSHRESPSNKQAAEVVTSAFFIRAGWKWEHLNIVVVSGAVMWWILAMGRIVRFQRVLRDTHPASGELQVWTRELAARLGLRRYPLVCMVPGQVPPMLWATGGRPRLLVPSELWSSMNAEEQGSLLIHELAHLKRRDHWVRLLELIVSGLYWWHPIVWWARRELREAEEQCCDAWVVWAMPKGAKTYAGALLRALEFVSDARMAPAAASAIGATGHVSSLKRRLRMIVRANTPKGLSSAGRLAVLGIAATVLPLAPSLAQKSNTDHSATEQRRVQKERAEMFGVDDRQSLALKRQHAKENLAHVTRELLEVQSEKRKLEAELRESSRPDKAKQHKLLAMLDEVERHLTARIESLGKEERLLTANIPAFNESQDREKKDEAEDKLRDSAKRFQEKIQDVIKKLSKELGPVGEEVRKALERAVDEVHKALEKEGFSGEDLGRALEKSRDDLRDAFQRGGPVEKELREAIERSRDEIQEALETAREGARDQVDALRDRARELSDQDRAARDRARSDAEKGASPAREGREARRELEDARREIRELEAQLRRATRRLEEIERRESRRAPSARREPPRAPVPPIEPTAPSAESRPAPPQSPGAPATPARPSRPVAPGGRRAQPPGRPGQGAARRGSEAESDRRLRELENKMNQLLKELENLKENKGPSGNRG
jgi:beta-lactamase regulating signal transducer with metallopeptidase domain